MLLLARYARYAAIIVCIRMQILLLAHKCLNGLAPIYLSELLRCSNSPRLLRSSSQNFLTVPRSRLKKYGDRAFSVVAPKLWNQSVYGDLLSSYSLIISIDVVCLGSPKREISQYTRADTTRMMACSFSDESNESGKEWFTSCTVGELYVHA